MNLFDPILVSAAHQRALLIEKQLSGRSGGGLSIGTRGNIREVNHAASSSGPSQRASGSGPDQCASPKVTQTNNESTSEVRCFGCSETDHRQADYKKQDKKALFVDPNDYEEKDAYVGKELMSDGTDEGDEEVLDGDMSLTLVVRQMCLTHRTNEDEWLRNNIFQSTCTI